MSTSQAEIWDDTALIDSWNAAFEEYKKYHSIKDNGEIIEERAMLEEKLSSTSDDIASTRYDDGVNQSSYNAQPIAENETPEDPPKNMIAVEALPENNENNPSIPIAPQHLIGQVQDEGIKNLLMSWYYAGYYTGLYEGQHRT